MRTTTRWGNVFGHTRGEAEVYAGVLLACCVSLLLSLSEWTVEGSCSEFEVVLRGEALDINLGDSVSCGVEGPAESNTS